jgi:hypothetical protein
MSLDTHWLTGSTRRRTMVSVGVFLLTLGTRVGAQEVQLVSLIQDDTCPLALEQVRHEPRLRSLDLVISGTVFNPGRRGAQDIVVTAALVDASGRVVNLQLEPLKLSVGPGGRKTFRATFEHLVPTRGERIAFGIQAVRWSRSDEWRGAVKIVTAPAVLASSGIAR